MFDKNNKRLPMYLTDCNDVKLRNTQIKKKSDGEDGEAFTHIYHYPNSKYYNIVANATLPKLDYYE